MLNHSPSPVGALTLKQFGLWSVHQKNSTLQSLFETASFGYLRLLFRRTATKPE